MIGEHTEYRRQLGGDVDQPVGLVIEGVAQRPIVPSPPDRKLVIAERFSARACIGRIALSSASKSSGETSRKPWAAAVKAESVVGPVSPLTTVFSCVAISFS